MFALWEETLRTRFPMSARANYELDAELSRQLDRDFSTIGQGCNAYLERRWRRRQRYLAKLSDGDLARMGITRAEIVRHVFRDTHSYAS